MSTDLTAPATGASASAAPEQATKPPKLPKVPKVPKAPKLPKAANESGGSYPPKPPKPPRRPPAEPKPPVVLTRRETLIRSIIAIFAIMLLSFGVNLLVFSHVQYFAHQQQLTDHFRMQLAEGIAPVSEGDVDDVLLPDGAPVAMLTMPSIGLKTVVVEGTSSADTMMGPGHRRDTVLPGQAGVSVIIGRDSAYGAPFGRLQDLQPGDTFTATTGQGEHTFEVMGLRYAGDPSPAPISAGESRIVFETARGLPFAPVGVARIDAKLVGEALPTGARQTTFMTLPPEAKALATDTTTVWALVFALQVLIVAEIALLWSVRRVGVRQAWTVFLPVVFLTSLVITDQVMRLLPNVL